MNTHGRSALPRTLAALGALALGSAGAMAQPPSQAGLAPPAPIAGCAKPATPTFPTVSDLVTLAPDQMSRVRDARDAYFAAADAGLACLDADIEARMRAMFASGAAMDPALREQGLAHAQASRERASVHEQFIRLCFAYEDVRGPLPGGCSASQSSAALTPR